MFEFEQDLVDSLLSENRNFERLYRKHCTLKKRIQEVNEGSLQIDDIILTDMKKEKLRLKDQMAEMISQYRRN